MTSFADPSSYYSHVKLSKEQIDGYFKDGFTVLRNAVPPETMRRLRKHLADKFGTTNSMWSHMRMYDSDELHDFYVYSNLGSLAAQLFAAANATGPHTAFLWREFMYVRRSSRRLAPWHFDSEDCDIDGLPARLTDRNRPRIWVPLDDGCEGPVLISQSMYASRLSPEARDIYSGATTLEDFAHTPPRVLEEFAAPWVWWQEQYDSGNTSAFPRFPDMRAGDVVIHSGCLFHRSPSPGQGDKDHRFILFPTYASGSAVFSLERHGYLPRNRDCRLDVGSIASQGATVGDAAACFPQVYPPAKKPTQGSARPVTRNGPPVLWASMSLRTFPHQSLSAKDPGR